MKAFIIFVTSILLVSSIIFSCGDDSSPSSQDGPGFDSGRSGDVNNGLEVVCRGSEADCSGSNCCGEDEDCADTCRKLFSGGVRSTCKDKYSQEIVNKMENIIETIFNRPTVDKLYDDKDLKEPEPLCALLELSPKVWINEVEDYNSSTYARTTLEWIVSQNIWHYFLSDGDKSLLKIKDNSKKEDLLELLEQLIGKLGGARAGVEVSDAHLLNGLTVQEVADEKTIFYLAEHEDRDQNTGFYFVHEEIVLEKICDEPNRPVPNTNEGTNKYTGTAKEAAIHFAVEACILAVYCKAGPYTDNQYESDRKRVARLLGTQVKEFIVTPIMDGGLGVEEDASEWPNDACSKLRSYWKNGKNLGLGV